MLYIANIREVRGVEENVYHITRLPLNSDKIKQERALSPSYMLLMDMKKGKVTKEQFRERYLTEIQDPRIQEILARYVRLSYHEDVIFTCFCSSENKTCHRYILQELLHASNIPCEVLTPEKLQLIKENNRRNRNGKS